MTATGLWFLPKATGPQGEYFGANTSPSSVFTENTTYHLLKARRHLWKVTEAFPKVTAHLLEEPAHRGGVIPPFREESGNIHNPGAHSARVTRHFAGETPLFPGATPHRAEGSAPFSRLAPPPFSRRRPDFLGGIGRPCWLASGEKPLAGARPPQPSPGSRTHLQRRRHRESRRTTHGAALR